MAKLPHEKIEGLFFPGQRSFGSPCQPFDTEYHDEPLSKGGMGAAGSS